MPKLTGLLLRERTLVAAGYVTTCDNELLTRVGLMYYISSSLVHGTTEYELKLEAVICIQAYAICFGKVNKGSRFVYYCSFKTNFCEDSSFYPLDFHPVLYSVNWFQFTAVKCTDWFA